MRRLLVMTMLAATAVDARAQEVPDTVRVDSLVVTATRLAIPLANAPGSVTVLSGAAMRANGQRFLVDALRGTPGVAVVQASGAGGQTSVFMRGGESDYVQVLVDGVQVNDPGGAFDWAHVRTEDIERVEIVRGPSSVLYGSDAVAGVVQIFTRAGGATRIEAGVTTSRGDKAGTAADGSHDTHGFDATVTGSIRPSTGATLSYGASAAHARSTGLFEFNNDYDNTNLSGRVKFDAARADAALTARYTDTEYHYPTSGSGAIVDRNQFATGMARSIGGDAGVRASEHVELRVLATVHERESRTENPPDTETDGSSWNTARQLRQSLDGRVNIGLARAFTLTAGVEREWQDGQSAFESVSDFGTFEGETDDERANTGWYAQLHGTPINALSITIGGRIDDHETFGTFRTGRLAATWHPVSGARIHASFGTAFKEPTFFENFATGFTVGDPDLEPEQARSWEAGAEYAVPDGALTIGATWFNQRFRNLIQYTSAPPTPGDPNYFNIGAARARGLELTASVVRSRARVSAGYTYTDTRVLDDGFGEDMALADDLRLLRRPVHQASASTAINVTPSLTALLGARRVGERDDLDFTDPVQWNGIRTTLEPYSVVDAGIEYVVRGFRLNTGVRNVFDAEYHEIYNFPAAGRVFHAGVRAGVGI